MGGVSWHRLEGSVPTNIQAVLHGFQIVLVLEWLRYVVIFVVLQAICHSSLKWEFCFYFPEQQAVISFSSAGELRDYYLLQTIPGNRPVSQCKSKRDLFCSFGGIWRSLEESVTFEIAAIQFDHK